MARHPEVAGVGTTVSLVTRRPHLSGQESQEQSPHSPPRAESLEGRRALSTLGPGSLMGT